LATAAALGRQRPPYLAARDETHNNAWVLAEFLEDELERKGSPSSPVCYQGEFGGG